MKWWQRQCNEILGHHQEEDGMYGKVSRSETIALQQKLGLAVDGVAGYNSIWAAFLWLGGSCLVPFGTCVVKQVFWAAQ